MDLSLGSARPMLAAMSRCASFVEFSLMTVNATCPGLMCFNPSLREIDRKSTRLNSSHGYISYAVFCLKKKKQAQTYRYIHKIYPCTRDDVQVSSCNYLSADYRSRRADATQSPNLRPIRA